MIFYSFLYPLDRGENSWRHKLTTKGIINLYCHNLRLLIKGFKEDRGADLHPAEWSEQSLNDKGSLRYELSPTNGPCELLENALAPVSDSGSSGN